MAAFYAEQRKLTFAFHLSNWMPERLVEEACAAQHEKRLEVVKTVQVEELLLLWAEVIKEGARPGKQDKARACRVDRSGSRDQSAPGGDFTSD